MSAAAGEVAVEEGMSAALQGEPETGPPSSSELAQQEKTVEEEGEAMETAEHQEASGNGEEKEASPAPSSPHSSITSPLLPLPDFMTALNMMPSGGGGTRPLQGGEGAGQKAAEQEEPLTLGPGPKEVLIEKFKQSKHTLE